ncbi:MAG: hypothetical protein Gaeavirus15_13 [Gaeavirus sp.]|uniref:Uncharacterized protein n=1 Tax=Gaeavirus sp. TaxID=2487767 RepID=A0A3G5A300_9VIRU|nr:MAG: hypothetical protein Gaeavirus15_13 [Gaeavirus sp.]
MSTYKSNQTPNHYKRPNHTPKRTIEPHKTTRSNICNRKSIKK